MKKKFLPFLSVLALLTLAGCSNNKTTSTAEDDTSTDGDYTYNEPVVVEDPTDIEVEEQTGEFSISTDDGAYTQTGNIYTITKAGTYTLEGKLEGQILVEAGSSDNVVIELNGVTITYDQDAPIKALTANKVEISAKKDTGNTITDNRNKKTTDTDTLGEGAIYAKCDLKLKGAGILVVTGNYNNGIHTTKDLSIQKMTLKATGYNNGLKGNNSVTITSGEVQSYATTGNGIKTEESDQTSSGKQKGTIAINGGSVFVDSLHDGIDASYNVEVSQADADVGTYVSVKTGKNSTFYNSSFKADSEKGLKSANDIIVNAGTIVVAASDDALHANYGTLLYTKSDNTKVYGTGNITVNDGVIQIASGDDGLHADNTLTINGGKVVVTNATEGFEGNYININGGASYIYGSDDGVNCSKKSFTNCAFTMTGGYLDVAVRSGDTDGIDSNGNFTLSGGIIVTRGSPGTGSGMSTGLDVDGTCSMTGGTLIAFNGLERKPTTSSGINYAGTSGANSQGGMGGGPGGHGGGPGGGQGGSSSSSSTTLQNGKYTLSGDNFNLTFNNDYSYSSFLIYSTNLTLNSSYTLLRNDTAVLSWTQSSSSVTISQ